MSKDCATPELPTFKVGDVVRFAHLKESAGRVLSIDSDGMLEIEGWSGGFAPHVLRLFDEANAQARELGAELWPVAWEHAEGGDGWVNVGNQQVGEFVEVVSAALRSAETHGAERERERCAMVAANTVAVDGHTFYKMTIRGAEQLGDAVADKIRRGDGFTGARPIKPEDLFHALRLGVEGTEEDRAMYLRRMAMRYQHIGGLGELAAQYYDPRGILRARSTEGESE